ncbi:hypothetical protein [Mycoplasmopsis felis]|uniref:hypothetical protein n=1 Tax=Mycoplasmopsis felis TaxID=33923 RepID=UPI003A5C8858
MLEGEEEMIELVELEVRSLLSEYGFDGDNAPIIRGSAKLALDGVPQWEEKVMELMDAVDTYIETPEKDFEKPFLMVCWRRFHNYRTWNCCYRTCWTWNIKIKRWSWNSWITCY